MRLSAVVLCVLLIWAEVAQANLPVNCTKEDLLGTWVFDVSRGGQDRTINCSAEVVGESSVTVTLKEPSDATNDHGINGHFTLIYNYGLEVVIGGYKWFGFFNHSDDGNEVISYCDQTVIGLVHDVLGHNWACFVGKKLEPLPPRKVPKSIHSEIPATQYQSNVDFIDAINSNQILWKAHMYSDLENYSELDLQYRSGGPASRLPVLVRSGTASSDIAQMASRLPQHWDWRDVKGVNFVSPVQNQENCGSCYSFALMAMLEARIRILTNNNQTSTLSPQQVVSCSKYSEGCQGGFPYLIGKYVQEFGVVDNECFPYTAKDIPCDISKKCRRTYVSDYHYVGGFFGGCSELAMITELVNNGPISVAFQVYPDFKYYKEGIYYHTGVGESNPRTFLTFELINHAVLVVGYGTCPVTGEKYWIVKNSWGEEWGEQGYFRIRRGTDECGIESMAVAAKPIPQL